MKKYFQLNHVQNLQDEKDSIVHPFITIIVFFLSEEYKFLVVFLLPAVAAVTLLFLILYLIFRQVCSKQICA